MYTPAGYVEKADVFPVTLIDGPLQPVLKAHDEVHAGQFVESPKVVSSVGAVAAHMAVVMSVQEPAPESDDEPDGHGIIALEPAGQKLPAVHRLVVPTAWPAVQK